MFKFELGAVVKDKITGYQGVIVARTEWLNNCDRYTVQSQGLDKAGVPIKPESFDDMQLELVGTENVLYPKPQAARTGGPMPDVTRAEDPSR